MTLSLVARGEGGAFGMVVASSSPAVAARCLHLRPGVGAAASQNVTDPGLGPALLDLMAEGTFAPDAVATLASRAPFAQHRQITAVDTTGRTGVHTGADALGVVGSSADENCLAAGNLLDNPEVLEAMTTAFRESAGTPLERRLLAALQAGLDRGGEAGPLRSAGLAVVEDVAWRTTDLRVDDHDRPVAELGRLLDLWMPQKQDYLDRALRPGAAPSYGVPGDE
ncbi:DUF1028 domain-containing protein [Litorihabitans aurantiacus]|uniref:DUF1028 domain-containing protein n=1 Tax=Litorihabitans aurantiacus TaxID=1930061 RepID=A0AA38CVK9_9MICO|nr:DUF1028 domain-containing protein [Litorihabitans aurantiacus]GMA32562.1 hypothetical protein GCM10025875_25540 [Litorihabitans aurantiacus]